MITIEDVKKIVDKYGFEDWNWDYEDVVSGMFEDIKSAIDENIQNGIQEVLQKIRDKGLESISKDDSIVEKTVQKPENPIIESWAKILKDAGYSYEGNPVKLNEHTTGIWRAFWRDRAKFEQFLKFFMPIKWGGYSKQISEISK